MKTPKPRPPYGTRLSLKGKDDLSERSIRILQRVIEMGTTLRNTADAAGYSWSTAYKISKGTPVGELVLAEFEMTLGLPIWPEPSAPKPKRFLKRQLTPRQQQPVHGEARP